MSVPYFGGERAGADLDGCADGAACSCVSESSSFRGSGCVTNTVPSSEREASGIGIFCSDVSRGSSFLAGGGVEAP